MKISILLTTYNREQDCKLCLNTLIPQLTKEVEVLLLDDFHISNSELEKFCAENNLKYIHTGVQKNFKPMWRVPGFAINIGAQKALGEYLIIGNAEIYQISSDTIHKMYATNTVSAPIVYNQPKKGSLARYKQFKKQENRYPFFMGITREMFFNIGGYDEDFIGYAWEDTDLCYRLDLIANFIEVDAEVVHLWNSRGVTRKQDAPNLKPQSFHYNKKLFEERKRERERERSC